MAERIHYSDLEHLLADDNTPDEVLAEYIKPAPLRALPLAPVMTIDESKVEVPPNRGIIGLSVKSLNERANRRRLAAYQAKIDGGWKGLKLLAEGDSWFLYPILLKDILDNLSADYAVYSVAAAGDTLENMMRGLAHFEELIEKHKFEGFLLSAGGNDIAGDMLRTYLTTLPLPARPAESYLSGAFETFLGTTQQQLDGLFTRLTTRFPDLKIFCHGYDWPFPRTGGLWLAPALLAQQIPDAMQHAILKVMIDRYYGMLGKLAEKHRGKVMLVDCRGSVGDIQSWFDELHPLNPGYTRAAGRFRDLINQTFGISAARGAAESGVLVSWKQGPEAKGGGSGSSTFPVGSVVTIGRNPDNTIVLDDERVSRAHARLEIKESEIAFADLNSTNGSLIDGRRRIGTSPWREGQRLQIGDHFFEAKFPRTTPITVVRPLAEAPAATPSPAASAVASTGAKAKGSFADFDTRGDLCLGSREDIGPEATRSSVRIAKTLDVLRNEINALAPKRSKGSDGWIGDAAHQSRASDHNPWVREGSMGIVTALDITHDPARGCDAGAMAEKLRASKDPRIKYIIWNRRIANYAAIGGTPAWEWRSYTGSNPHNQHFHLSVQSDKASYDSDAPWLVPKANDEPPQPTPAPAAPEVAAPPAVASARPAATPSMPPPAPAVATPSMPTGAPAAVTRELLTGIAPKPGNAEKAQFWEKYVAALASPAGAEVLAKYELDQSPQRLVMILANMMQETGGFTLVWESMKYSADRMLKIFGQGAGLTREEAEELAFKEKEIAERVYGLGNPRKAKVLGNTEPGDGWRYRGGGFLQTTGRENYRVLGKLIGVDLEANPELIEDPLVSLKAACAEWHKMGLSAYADRNEFKACCNGINAGNPKRPADPNGYDERLRYFRKCSAAFRVPGTRGAAPDGDLEVGDFGPEIEAVQRRLIELERYSGEPDGVFTPSLRASVLAFQADHGLATTGRVDEATRALLMQDDAQPNWAAEVTEEVAEVAEEALRGGEAWWREPDVSLGHEPERTRAVRVLGRDQVRWAEDGVQPDYRHLDVAFADKDFELTAEDLELIIKANRFEATREHKRILFGLRGAMLASGSSASGPSLKLRLTRPNHREFRCTIGVYDTSSGALSAFIGSTVPWFTFVHGYYAGGEKANMLPTGCYPYFVGAHGARQIPGCFRLGKSHADDQQETVAVLRTLNDVTYDTSDEFDPSIPHDNLHPAFGTSTFSSAGCQTVRGTYANGHTGEWAQFRKAVGLSDRGDNGKRFDYVLITGVEASIAAKLRGGDPGAALARLARLRHGSRGDLVKTLQEKLKLPPSGLFGAAETKALAALQRAKLGAADGIFSPATDTSLELGVLGPGSPAMA